MAIDALVKPLLRLELFHGLKPIQLTEIARRAERITFKPGSVILTRGMAGDAAVLVVSTGAVRIEGPEVTDHAQPIEPGSLLGELAMLIEHTYGSTIVATGPVKALRITRADMHAMILEDRHLGDHLVQRIAARLLKVRDELRRIDGTLAAPFDPSPVQPHA